MSGAATPLGRGCSHRLIPQRDVRTLILLGCIQTEILRSVRRQIISNTWIAFLGDGSFSHGFTRLRLQMETVNSR
jgi:hypothetical protein